MEGRVPRGRAGVSIVGEKRARGRKGQVLVPEADGWVLVVGRERKGEWEEGRKIIVWGVDEVRFHEGDVKTVCMQAGLGGRECQVRRTGRGKGRRVEIRLLSDQLREEWFVPLQEAMRVRGWHAVRGRPYEERAERRKSSVSVQQGSVVEIALANYYSLLEKIGEGPEKVNEGGDAVPRVTERRGGSSRPLRGENGRERRKEGRGREE
jgi:hypothetical protein